MPIPPCRRKPEGDDKPPEKEVVKPATFFDKASRLMNGKRRVWKCPDCGLRHYYDPVDRCRWPCGYKGEFYPELE